MPSMNTVEFQVSGEYALFTTPLTRTGGEKCSYPVPTYGALQGIVSSIYWKPAITWFVDKVRVMNPIVTVKKGMRPGHYQDSGNDLAYYLYLWHVSYQVQAHFEQNKHRRDWVYNPQKHLEITKHAISRGGRRDVFLGTRECQAYVEPCVFGSGAGAYDNMPYMPFGEMFHGFTYPDDAYSDETEGRLSTRFWQPVMEQGVITFPRPEDCQHLRVLHPMEMTEFPYDPKRDKPRAGGNAGGAVR